MRTFHPLGTWVIFIFIFIFLLQYPHVHIYVERVSCSSCNLEVGQIIVTEFSLFISPDQTKLALGHGSNAALTAHYFASMSLNLILSQRPPAHLFLFVSRFSSGHPQTEWRSGTETSSYFVLPSPDLYLRGLTVHLLLISSLHVFFEEWKLAGTKRFNIFIPFWLMTLTGSDENFQTRWKNKKTLHLPNVQFPPL